ncbi:T9SS type A sorting domain-containing protein [Aegicerativicinus sediminis]|uniref:T9SS type A sorting domain-containing protein n=1 Tax=Aegicerativicinus sediminis TaxID=2893202 RepID=UPI001E629B07|nr:T9SS type A sorting domain-containing protein [Aegicerativicinus sediminis]
MKKKLLIALAFLFSYAYSFSQTTVSTGDIAIIALDVPTEDFAFVTFIDLEAGTTIYFTDNLMDGDYIINGNETVFSYTVPSGGISAGSVIRYKAHQVDFDKVAGGGPSAFKFSPQGDNITAYIGSPTTATTFLHAIGKTGLVGTFPDGFNFILRISTNNGQYTGTRTGLSSIGFFEVINQLSGTTPFNPANWNVTASSISPIDETLFTLSTDPEIGVVPQTLLGFQYYQENGPSASDTFIVSGINLTEDLTIIAQDYFEISTDDSNYSTSISLTPSNGRIQPTTIYVRLAAGLMANGSTYQVYQSTINIGSSGLEEIINLEGLVIPRPPILISGVMSGPLPSDTPKVIELYVLEDIADLSEFGVGVADNGGGSDNQEFTFPAISVAEGTYIYLTGNANRFTEFFGFAPDYVDNSLKPGGDDAVELYQFGDIIDIYGDPDVDGTGTAWEYTQAWAYRIPGTGPDGYDFNINNWNIIGIDALANETTNATAVNPFPIGSYMIVWTGTVNTDWNEPANWSSFSVPTGANNVAINNVPNLPIIDGNVVEFINNIRLRGGLTINPGSSLVANGDVIGDPGFITVQSGGSLLTEGIITGDQHTIIRNTTFTGGQYSVVGPPVSGETASVLGSVKYEYVETRPYGVDGSGRYAWVGDNFVMPVADALFSAYTGTVTFVGNPNNGTYTRNLVYNLDQDGTEAGYNLVSNPYPSAISYANFIIPNTDVITGELWIWDDDNPVGTQGTNADYVTINIFGAAGGNNPGKYNDHVGTAQGFFVKANVENGVLEFNNDMRVTGSNEDASFFRTSKSVDTEELSSIRFKLTAVGNKYEKDIIVGFADEATMGIDNIYDGRMIGGNPNLEFYSYIDNQPYLIQGIPFVTNETVIPLGMSLGYSGTYEISVMEMKNLDSSIDMYILDSNDNSLTPITMDSPKKFTSEANFDSARFSVVFVNNLLSVEEEVLAKDGIKVYTTNNGIELKLFNDTTLPNANITVYDMLGKTVISKNVVNSFNTVEISHKFDPYSSYILKLESGNKSYIKKIIIKE